MWWFRYHAVNRHTGEVVEEGRVPGYDYNSAIADMYAIRKLNPADVVIYIDECLGAFPK